MAWKYNIGQRVRITYRNWGDLRGREGIIIDRREGQYLIQFPDNFIISAIARHFIPLNNIPQNAVEYDETWI